MRLVNRPPEPTTSPTSRPFAGGGAVRWGLGAVVALLGLSAIAQTLPARAIDPADITASIPNRGKDAGAEIGRDVGALQLPPSARMSAPPRTATPTNFAADMPVRPASAVPSAVGSSSASPSSSSATGSSSTLVPTGFDTPDGTDMDGAAKPENRKKNGKGKGAGKSNGSANGSANGKGSADASTTPPSTNMLRRLSASGDKAGQFVFIVDQDLKSFLTDFASRNGMRVDVDSNVRGRITSTRMPADPVELMKELTSKHNVEWYVDGDMLKVSPRADLATRILPLQGVEMQTLTNELNALGLNEDRYPVQKIGEGTSVQVTGPTSYVARISAVIEALARGRNGDGDGGIRIVRFGHEQKLPPR